MRSWVPNFSIVKLMRAVSQRRRRERVEAVVALRPSFLLVWKI